jgi:hypothetical protein
MSRIAEMHSDTNGYAHTVKTVNIWRIRFNITSITSILIEMDNAWHFAYQRKNDF